MEADSEWPTAKPLELAGVLIDSFSDPGDLVLETHCGSGPMIRAARDMERGWVGIDNAPLAEEAIAAQFGMEGGMDDLFGPTPDFTSLTPETRTDVAWPGRGLAGRMRKLAHAHLVRMGMQDDHWQSEIPCDYCGKLLSEGEIHVEHPVPVKLGGQNSEENVVASCKRMQLHEGVAGHGLRDTAVGAVAGPASAKARQQGPRPPGAAGKAIRMRKESLRQQEKSP